MTYDGALRDPITGWSSRSSPYEIPEGVRDVPPRILRLAFIAWACLPSLVAALAAPALIRYPNVHGDSVVFVARDALWTVSTAGGKAIRVKDVPATPAAPRYSPDGKWIAFTARDKGNDDVYVVPAAGGAARRLTWAPDISASPASWWGPNNLVVGWTPDSRNILFLSRTYAIARNEPLLTRVPVGGGLPDRVDLNDAAMLSYSPDGSAVAYSRTFTAYRPWKRYDGGLAPDVFVYQFSERKLSRLTDWKGTDDFPMWSGRQIYFLSDRDGHRRANIWVMDASGTNPVQVTHFEDQDIDFPSLGDKTIAFQQAGKLWLLDTSSRALHQVVVDVPDDGAATTPQNIALGPYVRAHDVTGERDYAISPEGDSVAFSAMGRIVRVDAKGSVTFPTARADSDSVDEDHPSWSPDGRQIAYVTDRTGEQQVVIRAVTGGHERALTKTKTGYYYTPTWSADGRLLLVADASHGLWLLHADGAAGRIVASDPQSEIRDAAFSPSGNDVAYSTTDANQQHALHIYNVSTRKDTIVSGPMNGDWSPRFSADGATLYFLSNRKAQPVLSDLETDMVAIHSTGIYRAPFENGAPRMQDATALPYPGGNYELVGERGGNLFVLAKATQQIESDLEGEHTSLHAFHISGSKDVVVLPRADAADVTLDGRHVVYLDGTTYHLHDVVDGEDIIIDLSGLKAPVIWQHVWTEMFENAWRLQRDMYYSTTMNGTDWQRVHDVWSKLLPFVSSHADFDYLISQLQGELGSSHAYYNGARETTPHESEALLGVDLELDQAAGLYRIKRILQGDNSRPALRSPLQAPGVDARVGDYILAIDGRALKAPINPQELLAGSKDKVTLNMASTPQAKPRDVTVNPLDSEASLRQYDWIESRRRLVDSLSHGRLAYVYLSNMGELGTKQFIEQFFPLQDKQGLIVDVRWNTGGFTSQLILERLRRVRAGIFVNRQGACTNLPDGLLQGPKAVVVNHYSASDGDQFPYFFRAYGLGPVIGTRTWGGVHGILGAWPLMDGTSVNVPKDVLLTSSGEPIIENIGTNPDIEIDDEATGERDIQLERAVAELMPKLPIAPITCRQKLR